MTPRRCPNPACSNTAYPHIETGFCEACQAVEDAEQILIDATWQPDPELTLERLRRLRPMLRMERGMNPFTPEDAEQGPQG
jgi:hypothetical protein